MYFTFEDTHRYISNNKDIIQQVVVKWNRKPNKKLTKMNDRGKCNYRVWITYRKNRANRGKDIHKKISESECLVC